MAANKSQAFIAFILNANVNEKDLHVAVLLIVDLTLLLRATRMVLICSSTVNKRSYFYQKLENRCVIYTSLSGMLDSLRRLHKYRGRTVRKRF